MLETLSLFWESINPTVKHVLDGFAVVSSIMGFFFSILPGLTAFLSAVWLVLRIYETIQSIRKLKKEQ